MIPRSLTFHFESAYPYLLKLQLVLVPVTLPHVSLLGFGVTESDEALKTLQTLMLICITR